MAPEAILSFVMSWAVQLSGYAPAPAPQLEFVSHQFMVEHACAGDPRCNAVGWYIDTKVLYVDETISLDDRDDILFHEAIHYLQDLSGKFDTHNCADRIAREKEAYRLQAEFNWQAHGRLTVTLPRVMYCGGE